jgi:hypothetical protein
MLLRGSLEHTGRIHCTDLHQSLRCLSSYFYLILIFSCKVGEMQ